VDTEVRVQRVCESSETVSKFVLSELLVTSGLKLTSKSIFVSAKGPFGTLAQRGGRLFV
jgi:hypothetical protein